ncbi:BrnA antitoxin family protein [Franzmannia pantelleriensis]|uniref:BrnA antitoxin family protein n=1 Tax=Franzmannia pantelleriensis TaxID=48727 RepID=UPI001C409C1D
MQRLVKICYYQDVIEAFCSTGPGWQTRINHALSSPYPESSGGSRQAEPRCEARLTLCRHIRKNRLKLGRFNI